ncbi:hypothetical protein N0V86_004509 [Didymella sp. IMI 355093]|nr:hypothetical protein N0V86_004509 [Didymella sp. IMI 355093]
MQPVYSQAECVDAIGDYYEFLAAMFMDPSFIITPPPSGWPSLNPPHLHSLRKTNAVLALMRNLPYIANKPYSDHPQVLPGCCAMDWTAVPVDTNPEGTLLMSQGDDELFGGRIPSRYLGLTWTSCPKDMLLLDTKYGIVHWQACPEEILASASPGPSFGDDDEEEEEEAEKRGDASDAESNADSSADSDAASDDELDWGPCWPVMDFFEMLKNQFRDLNFVPKNSHQVIDVWTTTHEDGHPIPPEDIKKAFGILSQAAEGATSSTKPKNIKKGEGKKVDDANPKEK